MATHWMLNMRGDPVGTIQQFLRGVYANAGLDAMLLPVRVPGPVAVELHLIDDVEHLADADPFAPLMTVNAARIVSQYVMDHPDRRLGAVLRACEIRALNESALRSGLDLEAILIIGVDCTGTFRAEDFAWRGRPDRLTSEALQFARQGGVAAYRYRPACQICTTPMPESADLTIDLLGLPARQVVMITVHNPAIEQQVSLGTFTDGLATSDLIRQHERMRAMLTARRTRARERVIRTLREDLVMDVDKLVEHLRGCPSCRECLTVCPIYASEAALHGEEMLSHEMVARWLASCAGCGMCEEACPEHLPLAAIFARVREELVKALDDLPENSTHDLLSEAL